VYERDYVSSWRYCMLYDTGNMSTKKGGSATIKKGDMIEKK
jgi:hypothetical protein